MILSSSERDSSWNKCVFGWELVPYQYRETIISLCDWIPFRRPCNIMTNVDLYRGGAPYRDDLTLLAFSINGDSDEIVVRNAEEI